MGRYKKWKFGDLNPTIQQQNGMTLRPGRFSYSDRMREAADQLTKPKIGAHFQGPFVAICIKVEDNLGWLGLFYDKDEAILAPDVFSVKARIPEIHAAIPDFRVLPVQEGDDGLAELYPSFVALEEGMDRPSPGDLIWVNYRNTKTFEDPIYIGKISNRPINSGYLYPVTETSAKEVSQAQNRLTNPLQLDAPHGDPIGQENLQGEENAQNPVSNGSTPRPYGSNDYLSPSAENSRAPGLNNNGEPIDAQGNVITAPNELADDDRK